MGEKRASHKKETKKEKEKKKAVVHAQTGGRDYKGP